jgi:PKD repeat protein
MKPRCVVLLVVLALVFSTGVASAQPHKSPVIVGFEQTPEPALIRAHGGTIQHEYGIVPAIACDLPDAAIEALKKNKNIVFIEPDATAFVLEDSMDWGIDRIEADLVWDRDGNLAVDSGAPDGAGVKVAVIDTGIDYTHPDLAVAGGASFVDYTGVYMDDHSHGTHCAGTIAGLDNSIGVIGAAPGAELYAVKVLDGTGSGSYSDIIAGIDWAVQNGMDVISMSLGGSASSASLEQACRNAEAAGVLVVAAAGNSGNYAGTGDNVLYPARFDSVIAVAALDKANIRPYFSSTGPAVEIAAPGVSIRSTYPGATYSYKSGTSMACPHVSATAALILSANRSLSNHEIRDMLAQTAQDLGMPSEWQGAGLVRADLAVAAAGNSVPEPLGAEFAAQPAAGDYPLTVTFTDHSTGEGIVSYSWAFGDGSSATGRNPAHTYTEAGVYTVSLTVTTAEQTDTEIKSGYIIVSTPKPAAVFTASPTTGDYPLTVAFRDASAGDAIGSYSWDFGDGTRSVIQHPTHTYSTAGNYTVSLTVTNPGGSDTEIKVNHITVSTPAPTAGFSADTTIGKSPLTVAFTDQSAGDGISRYAWDFGDGITSVQQNPVYTYTEPGVYSVSLTVTNSGGSDTAEKKDYITVIEPTPPVAAFEASPTTGKEDLLVQFSDRSSNNPATWLWNFGDRTTATDQNPAHTYTNPGTYSVTLTVENEDGSDTVTKTDCISVIGKISPIASFTADPSTGKAPLRVTFADTSQGAARYSWTFGDSSPVSTDQNPTHTYETPGTYTVTLSVESVDGLSDTASRAIIVSEKIPPVASFFASPATGTAPLTVAFTDASENAVTYSWDFGDGQTSTEKNPTYFYSSAGTYKATLTVTSVDHLSDSASQIITVAEPVLPKAAFNANPASGKEPLVVTFSDASENAVIWFWDFGDGSTATEQNLTHTYTADGTYTATLTVTSKDGYNDTTRTTITVYPRIEPTAAFTADPISGTAPLTVSFTDQSENAVSWLWDFGDGSTATELNPDHTYTTPGTYMVVLKVVSIDGISDLATTTINARELVAPTAAFNADPITGTAPLTVFFTDTSENAVAWYWDFGEPDTSATTTDQHPSHTYITPGTYIAILTVFSPDGLTDTAAATITVGEPPVPIPPDARFTFAPDPPKVGLKVRFTDQSVDMDGSVREWLWHFGDGTISTLQNPKHIYQSPGTFWVTLLVMDNDGNSGEESAAITVREQNPGKGTGNENGRGNAKSYIKIS